MPVNDRILYTDFNSIRDAIADILGTGSGSSGYGQTVRSSRVSGASGSGPVSGGGIGASNISTIEYTNLRSDIINVYRHIYGSDPTPASPSVGQLIRYVEAAGAVTSEYGLSEYGIAEYNATSIEGSSDPYSQFSIFVTDLQNSRFNCATSQSLTEGKGSVVRVLPWGGGNSSIACRVSVSFSNNNAARYFFNSGGEIRITSQRLGGSISSQNNSWSSLLGSSGTRIFGANQPSSSLSGTAGNNWYTLTNSFQTWYSNNGSSPYGLNQYRIMARTLNGAVTNNNSGGSSGVDFLVVYQDSYRDPDDVAGTSGSPPFRTPPDDQVDGNLQLAVTVKRATGVLVPEGVAGSFVIESPIVTYTGNGSNIPNEID